MRKDGIIELNPDVLQQDIIKSCLYIQICTYTLFRIAHVCYRYTHVLFISRKVNTSINFFNRKLANVTKRIAPKEWAGGVGQGEKCDYSKGYCNSFTLFFFFKEGLAMLPTLVSDSWTQGIFPIQPSEQLELQVHTTVPGPFML